MRSRITTNSQWQVTHHQVNWVNIEAKLLEIFFEHLCLFLSVY